MKTTITSSLVLAAMLAALPARADSPATCAPTSGTEDPTRLLRQVTLDLYGRPPTEAEYEAVRAAGTLSETLLDAMLEDDEHLAELERYHRALVLDTTTQLPNLSAPRYTLVTAGSGANRTLYSRIAASTFRGEVGLSCANVLHDRFDGTGAPIALVDDWTVGSPIRNAAGDRASAPLAGTGASCTATDPCRIDGYVELEPYWAPGTTVRVCAFEAQDQETAIDTRGATRRCDPRATENSGTGGVSSVAGCGCGPGLAYCTPSSSDPIAQDLRAAIEEEPIRIFDDVVRNRRDYYDALTTRDTFVDGRTAHYLRVGGGGVVYEAGSGAPDLAYSAGWQRVTRGAEHAGVLTTMAYLIRFTSHRGRVAHFRQSFLCLPFPETPLPPTEGEPPVDLTQRGGCSGCHVAIEPATQYWGRFRTTLDYGAIARGDLSLDALEDASSNPLAAPCATCGGSGNCPEYCDLYYFTATNTPTYARDLVGRLQVAAFDWGAEGLTDDRARFEGGPRAYVEASLALGTADVPSLMESCTVRRRAESLLHRSLFADEYAWIEELALAFRDTQDHDFLALERAILTDPRYRRIGSPSGGPMPIEDCSSGRATAGASEVMTRGCAGCHGEDLAGGTLGISGRNLTQLGGWSDAEITNAILRGTDRGGRPLCDAMARYETLGMSPMAACDVVAYLRSLPPIDRDIPDTCL